MINYKEYIKDVSDFPKEGISFKDISPLLSSPDFPQVIMDMRKLVQQPDYWVGIDARGFLFAGALAYEYGGGVIMCRKKVSYLHQQKVIHMNWNMVKIL